MGCCNSTNMKEPPPVLEGEEAQNHNNNPNGKDIEIVYDNKAKEPHNTTATNKHTIHNDAEIVYNKSEQPHITKTDDNKPTGIVVTNTTNILNTTGVSTSYSPINDTIDINADEDKIQYQIKLEQQELEQKFQEEANKYFRNATFETQLKQQQSQHFDSLHTVWNKYATNDAKTKMNMKSLLDALEVFGIVIDGNRDLKKFVFNAFDSDNNKRWIDYNDFSSQLSAIVSSKDINALELLFQIFDIDQDGYLEYEDMARLLLAVNQIAVVATGEQENCTVIYTKKQCLKQAKRMISKHNLNGNKISFDQFVKMMKTKTEKDMMFDHMEQPSISFVIDAPRVSVL
eukprot:164278_1